MTDRTTITITIRPLPGVDTDQALKRLLKAMLRGYGFKCLSIRDAEPPSDAVADRDGIAPHPEPEAVRSQPEANERIFPAVCAGACIDTSNVVK